LACDRGKLLELNYMLSCAAGLFRRVTKIAKSDY